MDLVRIWCLTIVAAFLDIDAAEDLPEAAEIVSKQPAAPSQQSDAPMPYPDPADTLIANFFERFQSLQPGQIRELQPPSLGDKPTYATGKATSQNVEAKTSPPSAGTPPRNFPLKRFMGPYGGGPLLHTFPHKKTAKFQSQTGLAEHGLSKKPAATFTGPLLHQAWPLSNKRDGVTTSKDTEEEGPSDDKRSGAVPILHQLGAIGKRGRGTQLGNGPLMHQMMAYGKRDTDYPLFSQTIARRRRDVADSDIPLLRRPIFFRKRGPFDPPLLHSVLLGKRHRLPRPTSRLPATENDSAKSPAWAPQSAWYKRDEAPGPALLRDYYAPMMHLPGPWRIKRFNNGPLLHTSLFGFGKRDGGDGAILKRQLNGPILHYPGGFGKRQSDWPGLDFDLDTMDDSLFGSDE